MNEKWRSGILPGENVVGDPAADGSGPMSTQVHPVAPSFGRASPRPAAAVRSEAPTGRADIADWGRRPVWRPAHAASAYDPAHELHLVPPGNWLVFEDATGVGAALCRRLEAAGQNVVRVTPGDSFAETGPGRYTLASEPGCAGYKTLLSALADAGQSPSRIAHLWSLTDADPAGDDPGLYHHVMEYGHYSLTYLAQAIATVERSAPVHVVAVTRDATDALGAPPTCPAGATLAGPAAAMARELSGVSCTIVDIEGAALATGGRRLFGRRPGNDPDALALRLLDDLLAPAPETVAYRGDRRLRQIFRPVPLAAPEKPELRHGGTYLVTGGLGRVGLAIARGLVARHGATVVLTSRRVMPPREAWGELRRRGAVAPRVATAMAAVEGLETLGGSVEIAAADVTDIGAMRALTAHVKRRHGRIDAVIHAASHADDIPLTRRTPAQIDRQLAPAIEGLRVLDTLFPDGAVDLMLLVAAADTAAGHSAGTGATDHYLHAYAQSRQGEATRVVAVDWGGCSGSGDTPGDRSRQQPQSAQVAPLLVPVSAAADTAFLSRMELETQGKWILDQYRHADGPALLPASATTELAAEALALAGVAPPFEIRDLALAQPVVAAARGTASAWVRLMPSVVGWGFVLLSGKPEDGQSVPAIHARARLVPVSAEPVAALDLAAIAPRCLGTVAAAPEPGHLALPQAAHLVLGPAWNSLRDSALGATEGLARLVLPEAVRTTLVPGLILHPALLDAAVSWALPLAPAYDPDSLYTADGAEAIRVFAPLPAELASWVRRAAAPGPADVAVFDITLAALDGTVLVEIERLRMHRRDPAVWPGRLSGADAVTFVAAAATNVDPVPVPPTARGLDPDDAFEALERALALGLPQVVIAPGDPAEPAAPPPLFTTTRAACRPTGASSSQSGNSQAADAAE